MLWVHTRERARSINIFYVSQTVLRANEEREPHHRDVLTELLESSTHSMEYDDSTIQKMSRTAQVVKAISQTQKGAHLLGISAPERISSKKISNSVIGTIVALVFEGGTFVIS